jgi:hypothetical protein
VIVPLRVMQGILRRFFQRGRGAGMEPGVLFLRILSQRQSPLIRRAIPARNALPLRCGENDVVRRYPFQVYEAF